MVPPPGITCVLAELHGGHLGILRMKSIVRMFVWWPGMDKDIEELHGEKNVISIEPPHQKLHYSRGNGLQDSGLECTWIMQGQWKQICFWL